MGFSVSVQCFDVNQRDHTLNFLQRLDWKALSQEFPQWANTQLVSGKHLTYHPDCKGRYMLGFNGEQINNLMLATCAWVASRENALFHHRCQIYQDATPVAVTLGKTPSEGGKWVSVDSQGVLNFRHESLLERGLHRREHARLQEFFAELSLAWPLGSQVPISPTSRRGSRPR